MKKICIVIYLILICSIPIEAQKSDDFFRLTIPKMTVVANSLYSNIEFIDSRDDNEFGNTKINEKSFSSQLSILLSSMINSTANNYTLFLQLRNLNIYNDPRKGNYILLRASLYEKNSDDYYFIKTLNEVIYLKDINNYQDIVSQNIANFISNNLDTLEITEDTHILSIDDVSNIELLEKQNIKIYDTDKFANGIYTSYSSFMNQTPSKFEFIPTFKKNKLKNLKIIGPNSKKTKISPEDIFAVVVDGQPYISIDKKYIPIYTKDKNLYFDEKISNNQIGISPSFSIGIGSGGYRSGGFGIGVGLFNTSSQKRTVTFKIDHLFEIFIPQEN